jgi:hypothetical protein
MGEVRDQPVTNILVIPEWQQLRTRVLAALVPYPEARAAVVAALEALPFSAGPAGAALDGPDAPSPTIPLAHKDHFLHCEHGAKDAAGTDSSAGASEVQAETPSSISAESHFAWESARETPKRPSR